MALILVGLPLKWDNRIDAKKNPAGDLDCVGIFVVFKSTELIWTKFKIVRSFFLGRVLCVRG